MGGIEHHDKTGHKVPDFEDKEYAHAFKKANKTLSREEARPEENRELEKRLEDKLREHRNQLRKLVEQHKTTLSGINKKLREEKEAHKRTMTLLEKKGKELAHKNLEVEKINSALTVLSKKKMKR